MAHTTKLAIMAAALALGCGAVAHRLPGGPSEMASGLVSLLDASTTIRDGWVHEEIEGATNYSLAVVDGELAVCAAGRVSASGLVRRIELDPHRCRDIEWMWRVDELQPDADIRTLEGDDVAASIFLIFGDPLYAADMRELPTLRYVWTNDVVAREAVIANPYFPETVRNIVVRTGDAELGHWVTERRDILADYERAFGGPPTESIHGIALLTDNDQTEQPVLAYYAWVRTRCSR